MDWIRRPQRLTIGILIIWKAVIKALDPIRVGLTWKIQLGSVVRVGIDPWIGYGNMHRLPNDLINHLRAINISHLNHIIDANHTTFLQQAWKLVHRLNIPHQWIQYWNDYIWALTVAHVQITEGEDEII